MTNHYKDDNLLYMNSFESFINDIKENRIAEIKSIQNKGYSVNKIDYKFFDYFYVHFLERTFKYSLFLKNNEVNFLIVEEVHDSANSVIKSRSKYYSMTSLFSELKVFDKSQIIIKCISKSKRELINISYRNYLYELEIPSISKKEIRELEKNNPSLVKLYLLFALIQNKSNLIFKNLPEYKDGIYRFFVAYCVCRYNNQVMKKRGWFINDGEYIHKTYFPLECIRIVFDGKKEMDDESSFSDKLKKAANEKEALSVFLNEYNKKHRTNLEEKDLDTLLEISTDDLDKKEVKVCTNLSSYKDETKREKCYNKKSISLGINKKSFIFIVKKFNKKYYLTKEDLDEIINNDPSKSSTNGGSQGSDFLNNN